MALYSIQPAYQDQLGQEDARRRERFAEAWAAYLGDIPRPLRVLRTRNPDGTVSVVDDNVLVSPRKVVNKGVSMLGLDALSFEVVGDDGERDPQQQSPEEAWLQACWRVNRQRSALTDLGLNGAIFGHYFLGLRAPAPGSPYPRVIVHDPNELTITTDPADISRRVGYTLRWTALDPADGLVWEYRQLHERDGAQWRITDQRRSLDGRGEWATLAEDPWPYPFPAIADGKNAPAPNMVWGFSDLEAPILNQNRALVGILSRLNKIVGYHASPKTWGTGFDAGSVQLAADELLGLPEGATLQNLEMLTDFAGVMSLYDRLRESYFEEAQVPQTAIGKVDDLGPLSGTALKVLMAPLLDRTLMKRGLMGEFLDDVNKRLLVLGGKIAPEQFEEIEVRTVWGELLPGDPKEVAETYLIWDQLGVSKSTLQAKGGFDAELEQTKRAAEDAASVEAQQQAFDRGLGAGARMPMAGPPAQQQGGQ